MHRLLTRWTRPLDTDGSAIFLAPLLIVVMAYLTGFFVDLGTGITKADGLDQSLSLAAAAASTQVSASEFYQSGLISLDQASSTNVAIAQLQSTMPKGTSLDGSPSVVVSGGAVCVRASEKIRMPFTLFPGISPEITYSSSSSAIARGSDTKTAPGC